MLTSPAFLQVKSPRILHSNEELWTSSKTSIYNAPDVLEIPDKYIIMFKPAFPIPMPMVHSHHGSPRSSWRLHLYHDTDSFQPNTSPNPEGTH